MEQILLTLLGPVATLISTYLAKAFAGWKIPKLVTVSVIVPLLSGAVVLLQSLLGNPYPWYILLLINFAAVLIDQVISKGKDLWATE